MGEDKMKRKILIVAGYYIPSVKGGGPIQSIKNLVNYLKDDYDFYILANDRDLGDKEPFVDIETEYWIEKNNIHILYTDIKQFNLKHFLGILKSKKFDILYLNSFYSLQLSIIPSFLIKLGIIKFSRVILAPRGNFSAGALAQKNLKKKLFLKFSKWAQLYTDIWWHATSEIEKKDIQNNIDENVNVIVASNLTDNYKEYASSKNIEKKSGELKLVYIARIHPMKNLLQTFEILKSIKGDVEFSIYGPIEDEVYWNKCQMVINQLGHNIKVRHYGQIANEKVREVYKENHVAILLTLGENFGHSISEALIGGCPVIISDKTPWTNLKKYNVGYDIPLNKEDSFIWAINHFIKMDDQEYKLISKCAFEYAKNNSNTNKDIDSYHKLFGIRN